VLLLSQISHGALAQMCIVIPSRTKLDELDRSVDKRFNSHLCPNQIERTFPPSCLAFLRVVLLLAYTRPQRIKPTVIQPVRDCSSQFVLARNLASNTHIPI
jgi:hypothetical protein